jgi:hypothetical protein
MLGPSRGPPSIIYGDTSCGLEVAPLVRNRRFHLRRARRFKLHANAPDGTLPKPNCRCTKFGTEGNIHGHIVGKRAVRTDWLLTNKLKTVQQLTHRTAMLTGIRTAMAEMFSCATHTTTASRPGPRSYLVNLCREGAEVDLGGVLDVPRVRLLPRLRGRHVFVRVH